MSVDKRAAGTERVEYRQQRQREIDLAVAAVAGVAGKLLRSASAPLALIVIGFILGTPLETNLRQELALLDMNPVEFFNSPIFSAIFAIAPLDLLLPPVGDRVHGMFDRDLE